MVETSNLRILEIAPWLISYVPLLAFLAPIIGGGEIGVMIVAFLFGSSFGNIINIIIFSCLGMFTADIIWFAIARSRFFSRLKNIKKIEASYKRLEESIERISRGKDVFVLAIAKIMMGTRILLALYLGRRKISFLRYSIYDAIVNLVWASALVLIGFSAEKGFNSLIAIAKNIQLAITFLIFVIVIFYILQKWINQKLMERQGL